MFRYADAPWKKEIIVELKKKTHSIESVFCKVSSRHSAIYFWCLGGVLDRQRAMHEDHELLHKGQPMARPFDVNLQARHSGVTVQQAVLDSRSPSAGHDQIESAESFVKFKNGSTTVFRNGNNLKTSAKPQIEKEAMGFSNIARPLNLAAKNTTNISLNIHQTSANRHQRKSSAISTRTVPESFANPNCRDMRYSCGFWLKSNNNVCIEQQQFMRLQCAFTCRFCTS